MSGVDAAAGVSAVRRREEDLRAWLIDQALGRTTPQDVAGGFAERLNDAGLPIDRLHLAYSMLHPLFEGEGATWTREGGLEAESYHFREGGRDPGWYASPLRHMIATRTPTLAATLAEPDIRARFPVLQELYDASYRAYSAHIQAFDSFTGYAADRDEETKASGCVFTFASKSIEAFDDAALTLFERIKPYFAVAVKSAMQFRIAESLAQCYIGAEAGRRVLDGSAHIGDGVYTPAVVLFADLRGSTVLAETLPRDAYLAYLNAFFAEIGAAIAAEGGEILAFLGDGALAVFSLDAFGPAEARRRAVRAVSDAFARIEALNAAAESDPPMRFSVGLHAGEVAYGNIGVPDRLSWSVIGPVVNETARLQELAKALGHPVLASAEFASGVEELEGGRRWRSLGAQRLRGVSREIEALALT